MGQIFALLYFALCYQRLTPIDYSVGLPLSSGFWIILAYGWYQQETRRSSSVVSELVGLR